MREGYSQLPIIMLSMSRWDGAFSSASISLAKEFSKNNLVFYIDNPFTLKDFLTQYKLPAIQSRKNALLFGNQIYKNIDKNLNNLIAVTPKVVLPINWMPQGKLYTAFSNLNNKVVINIIRKIKRDYNIKDFILFNSFNPFYGHNLPADIKPRLTVYQSRDDISQSDYVKEHGVQMEVNAINRSDLSIATSLGLIRKLSKGERNIHYLPNAADISIFKEVFKPLKRPKEIEGVDKEIIGYTGNICHRIDYELVRRIATIHHDKILLMVGPINNKQFFQFNLDKMPNVISTGAKPINELPAYLKYMNCTLIPFHCNELTKSIYPLKINEYLAAGKPVISTNFSEDVESFEDLIYLADNHDTFLNCIDKALNEENDKFKIEERVSVAEGNTWEARVNLFWNLIEENKYL